jgi:hypothetical protein
MMTDPCFADSPKNLLSQLQRLILMTLVPYPRKVRYMPHHHGGPNTTLINLPTRFTTRWLFLIAPMQTVGLRRPDYVLSECTGAKKS